MARRRLDLQRSAASHYLGCGGRSKLLIQTDSALPPFWASFCWLFFHIKRCGCGADTIDELINESKKKKKERKETELSVGFRTARCIQSACCTRPHTRLFFLSCLADLPCLHACVSRVCHETCHIREEMFTKTRAETSALSICAAPPPLSWKRPSGGVPHTTRLCP